jgi:hypothetical protein
MSSFSYGCRWFAKQRTREKARSLNFSKSPVYIGIEKKREISLQTHYANISIAPTLRVFFPHRTEAETFAKSDDANGRYELPGGTPHIRQREGSRGRGIDDETRRLFTDVGFQRNDVCSQTVRAASSLMFDLLVVTLLGLRRLSNGGGGGGGLPSIRRATGSCRRYSIFTAKHLHCDE